MRRALIIAIPLVVAVPIAYGAVFTDLGHPPLIPALLAGAAGWLVALVLRTPIGLVGMKVTGSTERTQRWVVASCGPLEESVRLAVLLLVGRDLSTALWIGLGWAALDVAHTIANGIALARLARRKDPEAEQARAMLPPSALSASAPLWGVVERAWASALHIGFTLVLAAVPIAVLLTAPIRSAVNVGALWLTERHGTLLASLAGLAVGAAALGIGWLLNLA
jgi:hypothetical protein